MGGQAIDPHSNMVSSLANEISSQGQCTSEYLISKWSWQHNYLKSILRPFAYLINHTFSASKKCFSFMINQ